MLAPCVTTRQASLTQAGARRAETTAEFVRSTPTASREAQAAEPGPQARPRA